MDEPDAEDAEREAPKFGKTAWWSIGLAGALVVAVVIVAVATLTGGPSTNQSAKDKESPKASTSPQAAPNPTNSTPGLGESPPAPTPSNVPSGGSSHSVAGNLCDSVDFAPVAALGAPAIKPAAGDQQDKSDYVAYTCSRTFAREDMEIIALVSVYVGKDSRSAAIRYADARDHAPTKNLDAISGLGVTAYGYTSTERTAHYTYQLWSYDGNAQLGVRLNITSIASPAAAKWRDAATAVGKSTYAKLK